MVLELEQKVKHLDGALESSKTREGFLQKDLTGLCITSTSYKTINYWQCSIKCSIYQMASTGRLPGALGLLAILTKTDEK